VVENREFDAFARRIVGAHARRVAIGDVEALPALRELASTVDTALRDAVVGLRGFGYSWAEIAARLRISRQAAQMRWGRTGPDNTFDPDRRGAVGGDGLVLAVQTTWGASAAPCDGSRRPAAAAPAPLSSGSGSAAAERIVSAQLVDMVGRSQKGVQ
jgi:hypothetical protein